MVRSGAFDGKMIAWSMDEVFAPYAKLDAKGKLTAKKVVEKVRVEVVGTIIGSEGVSATVAVDIFPTVSAVEIVNGKEMVNNKTISVDSSAETLELTANIYPLDAMDGVEWTVSDSKKEDFASYKTEGNCLTVTPKRITKVGTVTVKAMACDGSKKTATVKLQFGTYAKTLIVDKSLTELTVGDKAVQLTATVTPSVVTKPGIVWSLKNPNDKSYVNLSSSGKISPKAVLAPVDVTVVATSKDGMAKDEYTIRIQPKDQKQLVIKSWDQYITKTTQTLDVNTLESITISAHTYGEEDMAKVVWSPLKHDAADIKLEEDGSLTVTMKKTGSITFNAQTADNKKASVTIKGVQMAMGLKISQKRTNESRDGVLEVASGKSLDLQATLINAANKKVTWSIDQGSQFATVSTSGKVTARKDLTSGGSVIVRATAADGSDATDTMEIKVRPIAQGVQVYSEEGGRMLFSFRTKNWWVRSNTTVNWDLSLQPSTIALDARVYPYYDVEDPKNAIQAVSWKSSAPKIADIKNGVLEIYNTGSTNITVTANDGSGQKVSFKLNVIRTVTELSIGPQTVPSGKNLNLANKVIIHPAKATNKKLDWEIVSGNDYATISNGNFRAKKVTAPKDVEVRVSSKDGGASTTFTVTIIP